MLRKLLTIACLSAGISGYAQTSRPPDYKQIGAPLPPIKVTTMEVVRAAKDKQYKKDTAIDGRTVESKDLQGKGNLILMMFSPTCSHCENATTVFEKNMDKFRKSKLLLVASKPMQPYVAAFMVKVNADKYPNILIGYDNMDLVNRLFLYSALPQINIYDSERKLVKAFAGQDAVDSAMHYVN